MAFFLCGIPVSFASAEEATYAAVPGEGVYLYSSPDETSGVFVLPKSYYVKVLIADEPFCKVEYHTDEPPYRKISGYCKKSELLFVDFIPERPFLKKEITVEYVLPDSPSPPSSSLGTIKATFLYYGTYKVGSAIYWYVYGNGEFGYVPKSGELTYEENTDYLTPAPPEELPEEKGEEVLPTAQIVFLVAVCGALVAVGIVLVRGKPLPEKEEEF